MGETGSNHSVLNMFGDMKVDSRARSTLNIYCNVSNEHIMETCSLKRTLDFMLKIEMFAPKQVPYENKGGRTSCDESDYGDDRFIRHSAHGITLFGPETCVPVVQTL